MENTPQKIPLTAWETKERAYLLALETEQWREKRRIAEDPDTTADVLELLARDVDAAWGHDDSDDNPPVLLSEAIAAHPNTPPALLAEFLEEFLQNSPLVVRAFCHNPVAPFLLLEQPDFAMNLPEHSQNALLQRGDAPQAIIPLLASGNVAKKAEIQSAANLHVLVAGEVKACEEGIAQTTRYWRNECARLQGGQDMQWHNDFVYAGLAPYWATDTSHQMPPVLPTEYPLLDDWFGSPPASGSPEEGALLRRIGPKIEDKSLLAQGLRPNATVADLLALLRDPGSNSNYGLVYAAILRHPATNAEVIREMVNTGDLIRRAIILHLQTPSDVLVQLIESKMPLTPALRHLAFRHPNLRVIRRRVLIEAATRTGLAMPFVSFVSSLHSVGKADSHDNLWIKAERPEWTHRMAAALLADATQPVLVYAPYERNSIDLLHHLAHDGNRLVRWAAQTRLADPDFKFTWYEEGI